MARMMTETGSVTITRKQLRALLLETRDVESATSCGNAMEYTLVQIGGNRVQVLVNDGAETEHDLIIDRTTVLSRCRVAPRRSRSRVAGMTTEQRRAFAPLAYLCNDAEVAK